MKVLLISETTLKQYSLINDNIDGKYLSTAIQTTQDIDLQSVIGPVLVSKLQNLVSDGTISEPENANYKTLLDDYIAPYLCWQVSSTLQIAINYKLTNSGTIYNTDTNKGNIDFRNAQLLTQQYERYANSYAIKLKNYLEHNTSLYPEYKERLNCEGEEDIATYGIYLGDVPYNKYNYIGK